MLRVHEIFQSLQGEGPFTGRPAVFLRLSGCLKPYCDFCDTPEALAPNKALNLNLDSIIEKISGHSPRLVVITGGEPFLQWQKGLCELEQRLLAMGYELQYESSGRAGIPNEVKGRVVLSPKPGRWPENEVLARAFALKVLIAEDPRQALAALAGSGFPPERIWLMPLGASRKEQLKRLPSLWELCVKYGYNLSARLHILAFDRRKGV